MLYASTLSIVTDHSQVRIRKTTEKNREKLSTGFSDVASRVVTVQDYHISQSCTAFIQCNQLDGYDRTHKSKGKEAIHIPDTL